jgi:uncharacterized protein YigE (DUF2233 family)
VIRFPVIILLMSHLVLHAEIVEESIESAGVRFRVVRLAPKQVQVVWKDQTDVPYRSFERVQAAFAKQGKAVIFIMNAGIFEPGGIPSGLHIEKRKTLHELNLADAPGNFFLKPNGVGVDDQKQLVFAITEKGEMVSLWDFAGLFLKLGCKDALFLDGDISMMAVNPDQPVASSALRRDVCGGGVTRAAVPSLRLPISPGPGISRQ